MVLLYVVRAYGAVQLPNIKALVPRGWVDVVAAITGVPVAAAASVLEAMDLMVKYNVRHVPVVSQLDVILQMDQRFDRLLPGVCAAACRNVLQTAMCGLCLSPHTHT
jgi:CBS domain-containing protein